MLCSLGFKVFYASWILPGVAGVGRACGLFAQGGRLSLCTEIPATTCCLFRRRQARLQKELAEAAKEPLPVEQ